ncbi:5'-3' exonuclease family protein [Perilla frutescens var. hirtella]|uniref:5'-3' exonuclease family protein n=1 Tax=Perilla frutescens var. hirtella TaxID=608512 RepID=A0AAD4IYD0_PERFH|nr:5'-3' exonuclease family protein [Perilla frutescens var. hirtella]
MDLHPKPVHLHAQHCRGKRALELQHLRNKLLSNGVHGLWELLARVGRRISIETLAGRKLAIEASIWMIQFMKAMRDEKGEMVRNAHILGFFRRICKLFYLQTKPVFVFDYGISVLKRQIVITHHRQRENTHG